MRCNVCGMEYGLSHACSGIAPLQTAEESAPPPTGFSPGYYLRLAFDIVRWDDVAIRRASRDANALYYGAALSAAGAAIIFLGTMLPRWLTRPPASPGALMFEVILGLMIFWVYMGAVAIVQLSLCHLLAKWFFGATGSYLGVMRLLLLAWFVNCLILIPFVGILTAGIAWTAVLMMVFEEVDGVGRMQAFLISAGINVAFVVAQLLLRP